MSQSGYGLEGLEGGSRFVPVGCQVDHQAVQAAAVNHRRTPLRRAGLRPWWPRVRVSMHSPFRMAEKLSARALTQHRPAFDREPQVVVAGELGEAVVGAFAPRSE